MTRIKPILCGYRIPWDAGKLVLLYADPSMLYDRLSRLTGDEAKRILDTVMFNMLDILAVEATLSMTYGSDDYRPDVEREAMNTITLVLDDLGIEYDTESYTGDGERDEPTPCTDVLKRIALEICRHHPSLCA